MTARIRPLPALRARELWDRARIDALYLAGAATRRLSPSDRWTRRVEGALERRRPVLRDRMRPLLEALAELRSGGLFIQVGAHDGQQQDPLRETVLRHGWRGIMVEPVPYVFARLERNYGHLPGIALENAAIGPEDGEVPFFHLADADDAGRPGLPIWFDALGSLRRDVVASHRKFIPDIDDRIIETVVPSLTFESLLRRHGVQSVDLLHTDTEGYDAEILKQIDLDRLRPAVILYESVHMRGPEKAECAARLNRFGYATQEYGLDTWCFNADALTADERPVLTALWEWITQAESRQAPLPPTRAILSARRRRRHADHSPEQLEEWFGPTAADRRYLAGGYDDSVPLPESAVEALPPELRHFRGMGSSALAPEPPHHPLERPRESGLSLLVYLRYLRDRGGETLLERLSEDGLFGCWTAELDGFGRVGWDLLDSVNELLFLERALGILELEGLRVLELGAGYGRLAHRTSSVHPSLADYCCVDERPEAAQVAGYHLDFRGCMPPARVVRPEELEAAAPGSFDLAVCRLHREPSATERTAARLARFQVPNVFLISEGDLPLPRPLAARYELHTSEPAAADPAVRELIRLEAQFQLLTLSAGPAS